MAVIVSVEPTLTVATANAPLPEAGKFSMPVPGVSAIISRTGVLEADRSRVLRPATLAAGMVLVQSKLNSTSMGANGAVGVNAKIKLCAAPSAMSTGVSGVPANALVAGSVA